MNMHDEFPYEQDPDVIGDASVVERFLKTPKKKTPYPGDALATHIYRLLQLHPKVAVRFRNFDLALMNDETKKALLEDINSVLGITPLRVRN